LDTSSWRLKANKTVDACAQATRVTWCSFSPDSRLTRFQGHKLKRIALFCLASLSFAVLAVGTTIAACEGFGHRGMQTRWRIDLTARALLRATPSSRTESSYADTATFDVGARSFGAIGEDGLRTHLFHQNRVSNVSTRAFGPPCHDVRNGK